MKRSTTENLNKEFIMKKDLSDLKIAILVADGFEESELVKPKQALEAAGAKTILVSPVSGSVKSWFNKNWSNAYPVDAELSTVSPDDFDALLLPGGTINPDRLRTIPEAIHFITHFVQTNKPIAAICHGPWTLINAGGVSGKKMTSYNSIKIDLINAGAKWFDEAVVVDENLVTSRKPDDIPEFNRAFIELLSQQANS